MEELKDKLSADDKSRLESEIKKVEDALTSNNSVQIKSATESLNKAWNDIASKLYQQTGAGGQTPPPGFDQQQSQQQSSQQSEPPKDEEVQDASYEVVDDDKDK